MLSRLVLKNKNTIAFVGGALIALGFLSKWLVGQEQLLKAALILASILGLVPILIQAIQALRVKVISIDVLVTVAVVGAFAIRNYEESAIVTFLFLFGAFLEQRTLNHTRSAIKELTELAPESALKRMEDGSFEQVAVDDVDEGDVLLVKTGDKVPVDGTVLGGQGAINEASITGESLPVEKQEGSHVFAGTLLENGTLQIVADRVGEDTTFGKIIELVEEAQDSKSQTERFIDRFSRYYTPAVLVLALIVWLFSRNLELAITILVLGCPGALVIGVPVSHVAGIGNGARNGVLLKGSEVIHAFGRTDTMVFDKTGTLTSGSPTVSVTQTYGEKSDQALAYLASIEHESSHPLAKAILKATGTQMLYPVSQTQVVQGGGIRAQVDGKDLVVGTVALMQQEGVVLDNRILEEADRLETEGHSLVLTAVNGQLKVLMGIRDPIRPGVRENLSQLKRLGVHNLIMLSGDNQGTVDAVSRQLGLTQAHGNMLPEDKAAYVKNLRQQGHTVTFVGDGVNDSPSLALAHVGIAMGGGTDVAIETSDVVLMNSAFERLPHALGLAKATSSNMIQNIVIAVGVVVFLLMGVFFSDWMNMSIGMLVHEGSILVVILNGMRLLRYRTRKGGSRQPRTQRKELEP